MSDPTTGWQPDPAGRHQLRWHDGTSWTDQVADDGAVSTDPFADVVPVAAGSPASPGGRGARSVLIVAAVALLGLGAAAGTLYLLLGDDAGPSDDELEALAEEVLDDLDLPDGGSAGDVDVEAFSLGCQADAAGDDEDDVVLAQVGPVAGADDAGIRGEGEELLGTQVAVVISILSDAEAGQRILDAYTEDESLECMAESAGLPDDVELDVDEDDLDVDGTPARVFDVGEGSREVFLPVGRVLVQVRATSGDDDARDDLVLDLLTDAQDALRDGGA